MQIGGLFDYFGKLMGDGVSRYILYIGGLAIEGTVTLAKFLPYIL
jgi:hypothetical protein